MRFASHDSVLNIKNSTTLMKLSINLTGNNHLERIKIILNTLFSCISNIFLAVFYLIYFVVLAT